MKVNGEAVRPGSILGFKGQVWKVIGNDTLNCQLELRELDKTQLKTVRYRPGQEINLRWIPHNRRG